jgi:hypothetical protein
MINDEQIQYNLTKLILNCDLKELHKRFEETNKIIVSLTESLYNEKVKLEFWKENIEILLVKYSFHSFTLSKILNGTEVYNIENKKTIFRDLPTIRILIRALIENYLTIYYLTFEPQNNSIGEFRYYLYKMSGLNSRQKSKVVLDEHIKKKENEKIEIENLISLISNNTYFKSLNSREQKDIIKYKRARNFTWETMIEISDLVSERVFPIWKLFSNTAHSELLGSIQFKGYIKAKKEELDNNICNDIIFVNMLNSALILNIREKIPKTNIVFEKISNELIVELNFWNKLIKKNNFS